jgi:acyl carrier protein
LDTQTIYAKLTEIFHDLFADDGIVLTPETTAKDIDGWDSFTNLNLMVAVESTFDIKLATSEIEGLKNVGDLVGTIQRKAG